MKNFKQYKIYLITKFNSINHLYNEYESSFNYKYLIKYKLLKVNKTIQKQFIINLIAQNNIQIEEK